MSAMGRRAAMSAMGPQARHERRRPQARHERRRPQARHDGGQPPIDGPVSSQQVALAQWPEGRIKETKASAVACPEEGSRT